MKLALLAGYSDTNVEDIFQNTNFQGDFAGISEDKTNAISAKINTDGYFIWYIVNGDKQSPNLITHVALIDNCRFDYNTKWFVFHFNKMIRLEGNQRLPYRDNCRKFDNDQLVQAAVGTVYIKEIDMRFFGVLHQVLPFDTYIIGEEFYRLI